MSVRSVASSAPLQALPRASLARRLGALIYEMLLLAALILGAGFVLLPWVSPDLASPARELTIPALPVRLGLLCTLLAGTGWYYVWSWTGRRRTLPMKTWRMRLLTVNGENLPRRVAFIRYLAVWIGPALALIAYAGMRPLGLGSYALWLITSNYLWAIVDRNRQFLHDRIAGTVLQRTAD